LPVGRSKREAPAGFSALLTIEQQSYDPGRLI
jgi:hypothetical protein